jgi:uncharacterized protein (TIGR03000 family)
MKYTMIRLAIAILLGAVVGNSANAGFGHGGMFGWGSSGASAGYGSSGGVAYGSSGGAGYGSSGGGSYSGYGSSGGNYVAAYGSSGGGSSGGASSGGSSGRPGLLSRLHTQVHAHIAAKHARRAAYASSGGGSGGGSRGYGSSGGSSGGYYSGYSSSGGGSSGGASYGSTGSVSYGSTGSVSYGSTGSVSYGSTGSVIESGYGSAGTAAPFHGTSTATTAPTSALVSSSRSDDTVKLNVSVPESAKVYVNDRLTSSTGEVRQFVSRGLEAGKSYRFEIRAEMNENGKVVTDTQNVVVTAGSQQNVRFAVKSAPKAPAKFDTAVILNVPENAEVTLAGNQTQVKGTTRVFKTGQLSEGDVWDDYVIQVKVGEQVKTQSIRLIAGDKLELSFDFENDANRLAAK